jgi:hypothetical protein
MVCREAGANVGEARLDPDAQEREQPRFPPVPVAGKLVIGELHPALLERASRMRLGECGRHVEVVHACAKARVEDRRVEPGIGRVQDDVGLHPLDQLGD